MLPITRLAIKATRIERNVVKTFTKASKMYGEEGAQELREFFELNSLPNKTIKPYSTNVFKRMVVWIKTFFENYKLIKEGIKSRIDTMKEQYGKLFTKKRKKFVKNSIIKTANDVIKEIKRNLAEMKSTLIHS